MGRLRDRRGYGQLRLPLARAAQRRSSWLDQDLRARRRAVLRRHRWDLAKILAAAALSLAGVLVALRASPVLQAGALGLYAGALGVFAAGYLCLLDGSLMARLGRWQEGEVGQVLRTCPGVFGVLSGVPFGRCDVDHVVLAPKGVFAVEVKALFGRREPLGRTFGIEGKLAQAHRGAASVRRLLARRGTPVPVRPVLVLTGPGAPLIDGADGVDAVSGTTVIDGVLVVAARDSAAWAPAMAGCGEAVDLETARRLARVLGEHTRQRTKLAAAVNRPVFDGGSQPQRG